MENEYESMGSMIKEVPFEQDFMPAKFLDLDVSTFGNIYQNPFMKIKEKALEKKLSFEIRCQALRYMQKIPRYDRYKHCTEICLSLLQDISAPISQRYFFFANNDAYLKLDYELVNACHEWFYEHADSLSSPLWYKILSAKYILCQIPVSKEKRDELHVFFVSVAQDKTKEVCYRADCAEILASFAYTTEMRQLGKEIIKELGELYTQNKLHTIYTNAQNVHTESISTQTNQVLRLMISEFRREGPVDISTDEIYREVSNTEKKEWVEPIQRSFHRMMVEPSRYEGCLLVEIMRMVWYKLNTLPEKQQLKQRFQEEMVDMDTGGCSSGYLTRLLNIFSGFYEDFSPVKVNMKEQVRAEIFAHLNYARKSLSLPQQDQMAVEMIGKDKTLIKEFLVTYSPEPELREETVVKQKLMTQEEFTTLWTISIYEYFGLQL